MSAGTERTWGVTPVPERLRTLSFGDLALLWGNLGVSLLVLVAGALLGPALGLGRALLAIAVGAVIGNALLGLAGLIGAERRVPAMVLLRDPLGQRASTPSMRSASALAAVAITMSSNVAQPRFCSTFSAVGA